MKTLLTSLMCLIATVAFSQTQFGMNQHAIQLFEKTNKELDEIFKKILVEYKTDTVFIENLKAAQKIWVTFRDAELEVKFPDRENRHYGSVLPVCVNLYLEKLTRERINTLKIWLEGDIDPNICNGSVKWIDNSNSE